MTNPTSKLAVLVTRGPDEGTRLDLDERERIVGRARDADLILTDPSVSRRHLELRLVKSQVRVRTCSNTAAFLIDRKPTREAILPPGSALTVGNTVLCLVEGRTSRPVENSAAERTHARTLLDGPAMEAQGMSSVDALMDWFDGASDHDEMRQVLDRWAVLHADASRAWLDLEDAAEDAAACEVHKVSPNEVVVRDQARSSTVTVPAHAQGRGWVTFHFDRPSASIGEPLRRLLKFVGRLCGSVLTRIHTIRVAKHQLKEARKATAGSASEFLGTSPAALEVARMISKAAVSDSNMLILGETGVGKTFVARLIHEAGPRAGEPLQVINCAAVPESLLESVFFGHEKGAFTGAVARQIGAFEAAGRGTLFLDELGEFSLASQAKLLSVLENRKFSRLGSNQTIELRARVICATNRDLDAMIKARQFREDLKFRIAGLPVRIPSLRERGDDLILLARQMLSDLASNANRIVSGFTEDAIEAIRRYTWPGNARELRMVLEYAIDMGEDRLISASDFPGHIARVVAPRVDAGDKSERILVELPMPAQELEQRNVQAALMIAGENRSKAAALLGISRSTLYSRMQEASDTSLS